MDYPTSPLSAVGADGAFQIGDDFKFGQDYTESIIRDLFTIPTSNIGDALGLITQQLLKVPLEVLKIFKDIIPGTLDDDFIDSATAVGTIITNLISNIKLPRLLSLFLTWLWERLEYFLDDFLRPVIEYTVDLWNQFIIDWNAINWMSPLTAVHSAWMLIVDFVFDLGPWLLNKIVEVSGLSNAPDFFEFDVLRGVWAAFTAEWSAISFSSPTALWSALSAVVNLIRGSAHWLAGVFQNLTGIELESLLQSLGLGTLAATFTTWATAIAGVNWLSPNALMVAIGAFIELFQGIGNWFLGLIDSWLGWDTSAVHEMFSSFGNFVEKLVQYFFGATGLTQFIQTLESLAGAVGSSLLDAIKAVFTALRNAAESANGLVNWINDIPVVGTFVQAITGLTTVTTLEGLRTWFRTNVLTIFSKISVLQLIGQIPAKILGLVPVGNLTDEKVNYVLDAFSDPDDISAVQGWSWDNGAAKVLCDGYTKELFFNTPVAVAKGDKLNMSVRVKTSASSLNGYDPKIGLWVLQYHGEALGLTVPVAIRGSAATNWVEVSAEYTVPEGVTSVVIRLAVEGMSHTGGTIWFDSVDVHKSGLIPQDFVDNLGTAWEGIWNGTFGSGGLGKTWSDMQTAAAWTSGAAQTAGTNAGTANTNLGFTWNSLWDAFNGTSGSTGKGFADTASKAGAVRSTANTADTNASTANGNLQSTWNQFFDAFNNTSGSTGRTLAQSATAAGAVRSTASSANANANTAITNASTAQSTANGASTTANNASSTASTANTAANTANGRAVAINNRLFNANDATSSSVVRIEALPTTAIASALGVTPSVGSGARVARTSTSTGFNGSTAVGACRPFGFFGQSQSTLQFWDTTPIRKTSDITWNASNGAFTVTLDGWYFVEVGFTVDAQSGFAGAFNVAPAVIVNGDTTTARMGADAWGSYGGGFGNKARTAQSSFIVYLAANSFIQGGYDAANTYSNFFKGDANGRSTYFSISLLNRSLS